MIASIAWGWILAAARFGNSDSTAAQLTLSENNGGNGKYVTYNTISVVEVTGSTPGVRIYDSTQDCATGSGCSPLAQLGGRLYAIDILSPSTAGGTPTMQVAWSYDFEGPSGASPMVMPAEDVGGTSPVNDQVYFDGSGPACASPCTQPEHPTLFALQDNCAFGSTTCQPSNPPTLKFADDFVSMFGTSENGRCPLPGGGTLYTGLQAAAALEAPESSGTDRHFSVWAYATCDPYLYRFDAQTGAQWAGNGASAINIPSVTGFSGYGPSSALNTVINSTTGNITMFVGAQKPSPTFSSYVLALDLETGNLLWSVRGPTLVGNARDTPFHGQFPIVQTSSGYVLIAATAGAIDGATILGIPLS